MDTKQEAKLARYLNNSTKFLWGLGTGNQNENYRWLNKEGFEFKSGSYGSVTRQLIAAYGMERLLEELIIPRVQQLFSEKTLEFLQECWQAGTRPEISLLTRFNVKDWSPFLEINMQFGYVERWGELAGLWFEEMQELVQGTQHHQD